MSEPIGLKRAVLAELDRRIDLAEMRLQRLEMWTVRLESLGDRLESFRRLVLADVDRMGRELDAAEREALIAIVRGALGLSPSLPSDEVMAKMGPACERLSEWGFLGGYRGGYRLTAAGVRLGLLYSFERGD